VELPENLKNLKFSLDDCVIEVAQHPTKERPVQFGISNGEIDYAKHPGQDMESIMNSVTVTHVPTRLSVTVNKFLPFRNRTIAIELLKHQVEERIAQVIKEYERIHKDVQP
jgi:hypothetical protein